MALDRRGQNRQGQDRRGQDRWGLHLWPYLRFQHLLNFAGNSRSTSISKLRAGKTRSKKPRSQFFAQKASVPLCNPAFPLLNIICTITIPFFLFELQTKEQKSSIFHEFPCRFGKIVCWPAAVSILMPPTFPIASLNRYTPNFSGVPQKLTWCQQFGLQIPK